MGGGFGGRGACSAGREEEQVGGGGGGAVEQGELVAEADQVVLGAGERRAVVERDGDIADVVQVGVLDVEVLGLARCGFECPGGLGDDGSDHHQFGVVSHGHRRVALAGEAAVEQGRLPAGRCRPGAQADLSAGDPDAVDEVGVVVDAAEAVADFDVQVLEQAQLCSTEADAHGVGVAGADPDVEVDEGGAEGVVVGVGDRPSERTAQKPEQLSRRAGGVSGCRRAQDEDGAGRAVADDPYGVMHLDGRREAVGAGGDEDDTAAVAVRESAGAAEDVPELVRDAAARCLVDGSLEYRGVIPGAVGVGLETLAAQEHGGGVGRAAGVHRSVAGRIPAGGGGSGGHRGGQHRRGGRCGTEGDEAPSAQTRAALGGVIGHGWAPGGRTEWYGGGRWLWFRAGRWRRGPPRAGQASNWCGPGGPGRGGEFELFCRVGRCATLPADVPVNGSSSRITGSTAVLTPWWSEGERRALTDRKAGAQG